MILFFHQDAEREFDEAIGYYEESEPGLGEDFAREVVATLETIVAFPNAWPVLAGDVRRCLTNRFPYGVLYSVEPTRILVLAVMHLHRRPGYWKHRR